MNRHLASKLLSLRKRIRILGLGSASLALILPAFVRASDTTEHHSAKVGSQNQENSNLSIRVTESIQKASRDHSPAVVRIRSNDGHGEIVGTGFYLDPTGTIITLAGIVQGAQKITVEQQTGDFANPRPPLPATLTAVDLRSGVAFLKVSSSQNSSSFISATTSNSTPEFTPVIGLGYPRENGVTPVLGMVTGSKNHEGETYFCVTHITASIPLTEGEGGAPVLDLNGKLVGIVISGNTQLGTCSILPATAIDHLHQNLLRYGGINPGWVGAVVEIAAVPQNDSRTRIVSVAPGSPAENAGIQPGDILLRLGTNVIHSPEDVLEASFYLTAGEDLEIKVLRKGALQKLTLHSANPPSETVTQEPNEAAPLLGESNH